MKIGILGTGHIGATLAVTLGAAGHEVTIANSRGPDTIAPELSSTGARAVTAQQVFEDVEVAILSIPLEQIPVVAPLVRALPDAVTVIDTSNYYPYRTGTIDAIEAGQAESEWVVEQLGRPIAKAWNAIGSDSLSNRGKPAGTPGRIAIPVAADRARDRDIAMALVEQTGVEAIDAGSLADSWRQQPGAPAYCTDLTREELLPALAAAERERLPKRRDLTVAAVQERVGDGKTNPTSDYLVALARAICM